MATRSSRLARADAPTRLRVVDGGRRRSLRPILVPAALVLVLAVFAVAGLQAYLSQEGFRAAKLERTLRDAEEEHELLRARLAQLSSPSRLQDGAAKLGLQPPPDPIFLRVPEIAGRQDR